MLRDARFVRLKAINKEPLEVHTRVTQQRRRMNEVVYHDGLEHVQLEVALRPCHGDGHIVAEHLNHHHRHRFALGRIDLAGHDRRAGLVGRQYQLPESGTRP